MTRHIKPLHYIALTCLAATAWLPVQAQNQFDLNQLAPGQLILNMNSNAETSVPQDTLNVMISYVAQGPNPSALQDEVNEAIREARDLLQKTDNIDFTIQGYRVYTIQPERGTRKDVDDPVWRAQQNIQLHTLNIESLLVVTARLQQLGLTVDNMFYSLSDEKHKAESEALLKVTLENLQTQAEAVAAALGKSEAELVEVNLNVSQNFGRNMSVAVGDAGFFRAEMAVPVAVPGETQVNVNISARVLVSE